MSIIAWQHITWPGRIVLATCLAVGVWFAQYVVEHSPGPREPAPVMPQPHPKPPAPDPALRKAEDAVARAINASGYDCQWVDSMSPYVWSDVEGYTVRCNGYRYRFYVENHGGRWSVKSD
jgi:hypothetical protein